MDLLAESHRKQDLRLEVEHLSEEAFSSFLDQIRQKSSRFLEATAAARDAAFSGMLDQALQVSTYKLASLCGAERASLFLVDHERGELWLRIAQDEGGKPVDFRMPMNVGIAGHVASSGLAMRIDDAYAHPLFNPAADTATGYRTRNILCLPLRDEEGDVFAVAQLLNRVDGAPFDIGDEQRFARFAHPLGVALEGWWTTARERRAQVA
jgi:adenylate cyclase